MDKRLGSLLGTVKGHRIFIQTHDFPDPDAVASAFGLQKLLALFGIKSKICYHGTIEKASTAEMLSAFNLQLYEIDNIEDLTENDYIINVDSQKNTSRIWDSPATTAACIDHHPTTAQFDYLYKDVRICGSCATLVSEYFFSNNLDMDKYTATALLYGLKMDTEHFTRGVTDLDIEIFRKLFYLSDPDLLKRLSNKQMVFKDLKPYTQALSTITVYGNIGFAHINDRASDGLIASVCDFMLTMVEIEFAVVYDVRPDGYKLSIRSSLDYLDAGTITANALEGIGTGGGHAAMAGGFVPKKNLEAADLDFAEEIENRFRNTVYFSTALQDALSDPLAGFPS